MLGLHSACILLCVKRKFGYPISKGTLDPCPKVGISWFLCHFITDVMSIIGRYSGSHNCIWNKSWCIVFVFACCWDFQCVEFKCLIYSMHCCLLSVYLFYYCTMRYASVVYAVIMCPSVTSRSYRKMVEPRITQTPPHDCPGTLVYWYQRSRRNSNGVTPNGGAK